MKYLSYRSVLLPPSEIAECRRASFGDVWLGRRLWRCLPLTRRRRRPPAAPDPRLRRDGLGQPRLRAAGRARHARRGDREGARGLGHARLRPVLHEPGPGVRGSRATRRRLRLAARRAVGGRRPARWSTPGSSTRTTASIAAARALRGRLGRGAVRRRRARPGTEARAALLLTDARDLRRARRPRPRDLRPRHRRGALRLRPDDLRERAAASAATSPPRSTRTDATSRSTRSSLPCSPEGRPGGRSTASRRASRSALAMHHGGPCRPSTDPRAPRWGTAAILRFARPVVLSRTFPLPRSPRAPRREPARDLAAGRRGR